MDENSEGELRKRERQTDRQADRETERRGPKMPPGHMNISKISRRRDRA